MANCVTLVEKKILQSRDLVVPKKEILPTSLTTPHGSSKTVALIVFFELCYGHNHAEYFEIPVRTNKNQNKISRSWTTFMWCHGLVFHTYFDSLWLLPSSMLRSWSIDQFQIPSCCWFKWLRIHFMHHFVVKYSKILARESEKWYLQQYTKLQVV